MNYTIKTTISPSELDILKNMSGKKITKILTDEFNLEVNLVIENSVVSVKNIVSNQADGDEYPQFQISQNRRLKNTCKEILIGRTIDKVIIFHETVRWSSDENNWEITADTAIKFQLRDSNLLLVAQDSLAGFVQIHYDYNEDDKEILKDYWEMKTNVVDFLTRNYMEISQIAETSNASENLKTITIDFSNCKNKDEATELICEKLNIPSLENPDVLLRSLRELEQCRIEIKGAELVPGGVRQYIEQIAQMLKSVGDLYNNIEVMMDL